MYARISALLVAFALAFTSLAAAQERFGNITGKVTDQTGAVLPGVTVTVTNNETQRSTVVVSRADLGPHPLTRVRAVPCFSPSGGGVRGSGRHRRQ
jgi:hypothetical protein